jgi:hypothetical protein
MPSSRRLPLRRRTARRSCIPAASAVEIPYGGAKDENDPRPCFLVEDSSFTLAGIREIAFDQPTFLNKVRETRAGETCLYHKNTVPEHGSIGWSLFSAWQK